MEDRFSQQLKKGVLDMLVLHLVCIRPRYGYELLTYLKEHSKGLFSLKEGTLYPILYRLEDAGWIHAVWMQGEGRTAPKKIYEPTPEGILEDQRRQTIWQNFQNTVAYLLQGGTSQ